MRLTKKQKAVLHWFVKRDCPESHAVERVFTNPRKNHSAQVRRHGLGRTIYSLGRKGLLKWQEETEETGEGYVITNEGRETEQKLWQRRASRVG